MSYWIDDKLMQGQLDLIAINLDNDVVRMISALSKVQIPPVTQTNQVCVKKKLWYGKTKTQCHDEQIPRALTPEEIAFVGKHLETAIRAQANGLIA